MVCTDRRSILGQKRSFWSVIESFEKSSSEFYETVVNVRGIPGIKYVCVDLRAREREREKMFDCKHETKGVPCHRTMVGRGRAWLRFVLMQKKMADHFKTIADNKRILRYACLLLFSLSMETVKATYRTLSGSLLSATLQF